MSDKITLKMHERTSKGTRSARHTRNQGLTPVVLYGHKEAPELLAVAKVDLVAALKHHSQMFELSTGAKKQTALIHDIQYDHLGKEVIHVDFLRVSETDTIHVTVPIELRGIAAGARGGGVLIQPLHDLHIECLATARPESIRVKIDDLQLGQAIHIRELTIPPGVKVLHDPDSVVVQIKVPAATVEAAVAVEGAPTEPEVLTKKKDKEEEEE